MQRTPEIGKEVFVRGTARLAVVRDRRHVGGQVMLSVELEGSLLNYRSSAFHQVFALKAPKPKGQPGRPVKPFLK